jgi:anti-anti-sigma regulatory factor
MINRFELPPELNIYSAQTSRDALLAWAKQCRAQGLEQVQVCAAQVCEVDGSGLQLLASVATTLPQWRLVQPSPAFADACRTLGFAQWLPAQDEPTEVAAASTKTKASVKTRTKSTTKSTTKTTTGAKSSSRPQESTP